MMALLLINVQCFKDQFFSINLEKGGYNLRGPFSSAIWPSKLILFTPLRKSPAKSVSVKHKGFKFNTNMFTSLHFEFIANICRLVSLHYTHSSFCFQVCKCKHSTYFSFQGASLLSSRPLSFSGAVMQLSWHQAENIQPLYNCTAIEIFN